jgi:hypothetical protein
MGRKPGAGRYRSRSSGPLIVPSSKLCAFSRRGAGGDVSRPARSGQGTVDPFGRRRLESRGRSGGVCPTWCLIDGAERSGNFLEAKFRRFMPVEKSPRWGAARDHWRRLPMYYLAATSMLRGCSTV